MRVRLMIIYVLFNTIFSYPIRAYNKIIYKDTKERFDRNYNMLHKMAYRMLKIVGIQVDVEGICNYQEDKPLFFVGNHRSDFDSLIMVAYLERPMIFIGKAEIKRMPVIGKWFTDIGCIFIDREDAKKSLAAILKGIERIKSGYSLVIFPEGGRTQEEDIREFKLGSMKLAAKTGVDIVPVTFYKIEDCYERNYKIESAQVKMVIGESIDMKKEGLKSTFEIANFVQAIIENKYKEMDVFEHEQSLIKTDKINIKYHV